MEEKYLDLVLVPLGLLLQAAFHTWLFFTVENDPDRTVIGLNKKVRQHWVDTMMKDPVKNGVLAVQTVRNNIMASTFLATTAITLASVISVFVSATTSSSSDSALVYGNTSGVAHSVKFFAISLCFLFAFLCHVQSIRHYAHVSFLLTHAATADEVDVESVYVGWSLNRGSLFWSLGLRAFYVSFTLFLWIFGPIPMLASSVVICAILFFLDFTSAFTRKYHQPVIVKHEILSQSASHRVDKVDPTTSTSLHPEDNEASKVV
ncbi:uncharacterized protein LOC122053223 [Zingiber officinale]|uniref:uncharacterized protein LOC122053223 n=1 Tax=Zingiber officinale TaxID=94328 RepID=UPI001C4B4DE0|nr:uncharacterized protein LOC122053223 [Zingiber officinale]